MYPNYSADLFWVIFITIVFSLSSLAILLNIKKIVIDIPNKKITSRTIQILFGLLFGLFSLYYFFIEKNTQIIFSLALLVPIMSLFGLWFQIGTYLSVTFCSIEVLDDLQIFAFFQFILIFSILFRYILNFSEKISAIGKIWIFFLAFTVIMYIYFELINSAYFSAAWEINLSLFVCLVLTVSLSFVSYYFDVVFHKTVFLGKKIEYENGIFINANFSEQKILEFVSQKNISFGFLCVFQLKKSYSQEQVNFLKNENAVKYWELFKKQFQFNDTIFFKTKNNNFAFFVPNYDGKINLDAIYKGNFSERRITPNDPLAGLEEIVLKTNGLEVKSSFDKSTRYKFNFYCSIYGVHSNSITQLEENAELVSRTLNEKNINQITCFNPNESYENLNDFIKFDSLKTKLNLEKIRVLFNVHKNEKFKVYYPHYFYNGKLFSPGELKRNSIVPKEFEEIFIKHLSAIAIKRFSKDFNDGENYLSFDYPMSSLYTNFDVSRILRYLHFYKIPKEKVFLTIDLDDQTTINDEIKKAIQVLKSKKIGFAFKNVGEKQINICEEFKPPMCFAKKVFSKSDSLSEKYYTNLFDLYKNININICEPL